MYFIYTGVEMKRQSKYAKWWNLRQLSGSQACVCCCGGELGLCAVQRCLLTHQSLFKDANIFISWVTALRVKHCKTFRWACFFFCLFFSSPSVSQILSLTLSGEQSSLCWPSTRSENRSNHLFIDWNIRGLRGSGRVGATKSGKKTEWLKDKK